MFGQNNLGPQQTGGGFGGGFSAGFGAQGGQAGQNQSAGGGFGGAGFGGRGPSQSQGFGGFGRPAQSPGQASAPPQGSSGSGFMSGMSSGFLNQNQNRGNRQFAQRSFQGQSQGNQNRGGFLNQKTGGAGPNAAGVGAVGSQPQDNAFQNSTTGFSGMARSGGFGGGNGFSQNRGGGSKGAGGFQTGAHGNPGQSRSPAPMTSTFQNGGLMSRSGSSATGGGQNQTAHAKPRGGNQGRFGGGFLSNPSNNQQNPKISEQRATTGNPVINSFNAITQVPGGVNPMNAGNMAASQNPTSGQGFMQQNANFKKGTKPKKGGPFQNNNLGQGGQAPADGGAQQMQRFPSQGPSAFNPGKSAQQPSSGFLATGAPMVQQSPWANNRTSQPSTPLALQQRQPWPNQKHPQASQGGDAAAAAGGQQAQPQAQGWAHKNSQKQNASQMNQGQRLKPTKEFSWSRSQVSQQNQQSQRNDGSPGLGADGGDHQHSMRGGYFGSSDGTAAGARGGRASKRGGDRRDRGGGATHGAGQRGGSTEQMGTGRGANQGPGGQRGRSRSDRNDRNDRTGADQAAGRGRGRGGRQTSPHYPQKDQAPNLAERAVPKFLQKQTSQSSRPASQGKSFSMALQAVDKQAQYLQKPQQIAVGAVRTNEKQTTKPDLKSDQQADDGASGEGQDSDDDQDYGEEGELEDDEIGDDEVEEEGAPRDEYDQEDEAYDDQDDEAEAEAQPAGGDPQESMQDPDMQKLLDGEIKPCRFYQNGSCKWGEGCKNLHIDQPKLSEEHCEHFVKQDNCRFGVEKCNKQHDEKYREQYQTKLFQAMRIALQKNQKKTKDQSKKTKQAGKDQQHAPEAAPSDEGNGGSQFDDGEDEEAEVLDMEKIKEKNRGKVLVLDRSGDRGGDQGRGQAMGTDNQRTSAAAPGASHHASAANAEQNQALNQAQPRQPGPEIIPISVPQHINQRQPADPSSFCNSPNYAISRLQEINLELQKIQQHPEQHIISNTAACLQMCPQQHIDDPNRDHSHFEKDQQGQQFQLLAVKKFGRPDSSKNMNDPEIIRPPIILYLTMEYMRDCLADQDAIPPGQSFYEYQHQGYGEMTTSMSQAKQRFMNIYSFMKDRTRQLSQDLSVANQMPSRYSISCLEEIVRYLIVAWHDGFSDQDFEVELNMNQMTGCLGDLRQKQYRLVRNSKALSFSEKEQLLKNEVEMLCYQIIASAKSGSELQKLLHELGDLDKDYSLEQKTLLQDAVKISAAIQMNDFQSFFKLFKRTNYMFACLMLRFIEQMRKYAIAAICQTRGKISGQFLQNQLLLRERDCHDYLTIQGFSPDSQCNIDPSKRSADGSKPDKFIQQDLWILDDMKAVGEGRLRRDFVKHGIALALDSNEAREKRIELAKQNHEKALRANQQRIEAEAEKRRQEELADQQRIELEKKKREEEGRRLELERRAHIESEQRAQQHFKVLKKHMRSDIFRTIRAIAKDCRPVIKEIQHEQMVIIRRRRREEQRKQRIEKQRVLFAKVLRRISDNEKDKEYKKQRMKAFLRRWRRRVQQLEQLQEVRQQQRNLAIFQRCLAECQSEESVKARHSIDVNQGGRDLGDINGIDKMSLANLLSRSRQASILDDLREQVDQEIKNGSRETPSGKFVLQILNSEVIKPKSRAFLDKVHAALCGVFSEQHPSSRASNEEEEALSRQPEVAFCPPQSQRSFADSLRTILKNGSISSLLVPVSCEGNGGTSPFLTLRELAEMATYLEKKSEGMASAQINLNILAINLEAKELDEVKNMLRECQRKGFLIVKVFEIHADEQHLAKFGAHVDRECFAIAGIILHQLADQNFARLLVQDAELVSEHPADAMVPVPSFRDYTLLQVLSYQCQILTGTLKSNQIPDKSPIEAFNRCLALFKYCVHDLQDVMKACARNEYHQKKFLLKSSDRTQNSFSLSCSQAIQLLEQLMELDGMPLVQVDEQGNNLRLEAKHWVYLFEEWCQRIPIRDQGFKGLVSGKLSQVLREASFTGAQLFLEVYECLLQLIDTRSASLTFKVMSTHMARPLVPIDVSQVADEQLQKYLPQLGPQRAQQAVKDLKSRFPREFQAERIGKRQRMQFGRDVITIDRAQLGSALGGRARKRDLKSRRKGFRVEGALDYAKFANEIKCITERKMPKIVDTLEKLHNDFDVSSSSRGSALSAVQSLESPACARLDLDQNLRPIEGSQHSPVVLGEDGADVRPGRTRRQHAGEGGLEARSRRLAVPAAAQIEGRRRERLDQSPASPDPHTLALQISQKLLAASRQSSNPLAKSSYYIFQNQDTAGEGTSCEGMVEFDLETLYQSNKGDFPSANQPLRAEAD